MAGRPARPGRRARRWRCCTPSPTATGRSPSCAGRSRPSRTVLVDRFNQLLGRPPIRYLTEWRLNLASGLLRTTDMGVREVGLEGRLLLRGGVQPAFKRAFGRSPAYWRVGAEPAGTDDADAD